MVESALGQLVQHRPWSLVTVRTSSGERLLKEQDLPEAGREGRARRCGRCGNRCVILCYQKGEER